MDNQNEILLDLKDFLNSFALSCFAKLDKIEQRIRRTETSVQFLQLMVNSPSPPNFFLDENIKQEINQIENNLNELPKEALLFKKLLKLGASEEQIKQRMSMEGIDPTNLIK